MTNQTHLAERTFLLISNELFKTKLEIQFNKGDLLRIKIRKIYSTLEDEPQQESIVLDLVRLVKDVKLWIDYNSEFLKSVFNPVINEYKKEFDNASNFEYDDYRQWSTQPKQKIGSVLPIIARKLDVIEKFIEISELFHSISRNNAFLIDRQFSVETKNDIRALISKDLTRDSIEYLLDFLKSKNNEKLLNEIVLLAGQLSRLEIEERISIISVSDAKVERTRINKSLLGILDAI